PRNMRRPPVCATRFARSSSNSSRRTKLKMRRAAQERGSRTMADFVQAPEQDVVISSRVRLARNYQDLPFSPKLTREAAEEVISRAHEAMKNSPEGGAFSLLRVNDLGDDERRRLVEHHLISYDLLKYPQRSAALISSGETVSVMLNEEDHLRIQGLLPGMQLERSAELAFN